MLQSAGVLVKTPTTIWSGTPATWQGWPTATTWASYTEIYRRQLWVAVLVNKIANASARLPLKVYERTDNGRDDARDHPYAVLLRRPNALHDPFLFWLWTVSTLNIYGEAFWGKVRDPGGRPVELVPLHPTNVISEDRDGKTVWRWDNGRHRIDSIERRDLVHFRMYNPDTLLRGMSPLEPLRATLENEDGARKANSALWRNGGRPSVYLKTDKTLSLEATQRLAAQWSNLHGGVDNWAKAAVLEEGLEAQTVSLSAEELQYIEARKLNREESCAAYDVPPPVVHILDRATFSNITEQMRSMYRDTMAPKLKLLESTLEFELRDGRFGQGGEPDFGDGIYAEFLMDEVLRGDFEVRTAAWVSAVQNGGATVAEWRNAENRPFIQGTDGLLLNAASVPFSAPAYQTAAALVRAGWEPNAILAALGLPPITHTGILPVTVQPEALPPAAVRSLMGRLSRAKTLDDIDLGQLIAGLDEHAPLITAALELAKSSGLTVAEFRARVQAMKENP